MSELKNQLQGLFANSSEQFADKAMEMIFSAKTVLEDIANFGVYIRNSSFANTANGNEYIYSKLRAKLTAVRSDMLIIASAELNLKLDSTASFDEYVQHALKNAHHVQAKSPNPRHNPPEPRERQGAAKKLKTGGKAKLTKYQE